MIISAKEEVILAIKDALESSDLGREIKGRYNIIEIKHEDHQILNFLIKDGKFENSTDYFWIGWISNQYYNL